MSKCMPGYMMQSSHRAKRLHYLEFYHLHHSYPSGDLCFKPGYDLRVGHTSSSLRGYASNLAGYDLWVRFSSFSVTVDWNVNKPLCLESVM